jgi:hypothetical protein
MDNRLVALDAQVPAEGADLAPPPAQPALDDVVHEIGYSEPLVNFVAEADEESGAPHRGLDPEALDPAIFAGLMAP